MTAKKIIADEIEAWRTKEREAPPDERYKFHGATCALIRFADGTTLQELRDEYVYQERRSKTAEIKDGVLDMMARNRAVYAMKAIKSLGLKLKGIDGQQ